MRKLPGIVTAAAAALTLIAATALPVGAHGDPSTDGLIDGGGSSKTDCVSKFQTGLELNFPAPPKKKQKELACTDGDIACDADGTVNGSCEIAVGVCLADDGDMIATGCIPGGMSAGSVDIKLNKKYPEADLQALQGEVDSMLAGGVPCDTPGAPPGNCFRCTDSQVLVTADMSVKKGKRKIKLKAASDPTGPKNKPVKDSDTLKLRCTDCPTPSAWEHINNIIFKANCTTANVCHTGQSPANGLNLNADEIGLDAVYDQLINIATVSPGGAATGMVRVLPGDPGVDSVSSSLLLEKLRLKRSDLDDLCAAAGQPDDCLGGEMPPGVDVFPTGKVDLVKRWIAEGALDTGWPVGATCGEPEDIWTPADPLPPPPPGEGFQVHFQPPAGFEVSPGTEFEGCQWIGIPSEITETWYIDRIELLANSGTHHIIVYEDVPDAGPAATPTVFDPTDFGCRKQFGATTFQLGAQDPTIIQDLPDQVSFPVEPGEVFGINMHYTNPFNIPIVPEIWVNYWGSTTPTSKVAVNVFPGNTNFSIPPGTIGESALTTHTHGPAAAGCYWLFTTHQHRRGTGIKIWSDAPTSWDDSSDIILHSPDWDHPDVIQPIPRVLIEQGENFWFQCQWDNGVFNDVTKRCDNCGPLNFGVCFSNDDCGSGNCVECNVDLGLLAEDEMCFIPGFYYEADFNAGSGQWECPY